MNNLLCAIEPLEQRRLLAFDGSLDGNLASEGERVAVRAGFEAERAPVDLTNLYLGEMFVTRRGSVDGIRRGDVLLVELDITSQGSKGSLRGVMTIEAVGSFDVLGQVRRNGRFNMVLDDGGTITGRIGRDGEVLTGQLFGAGDLRGLQGRLRLFSEDTDEFSVLFPRFTDAESIRTFFNPSFNPNLDIFGRFVSPVDRLDFFDPRTFNSTFGRDRIGFFSPVSGSFTHNTLGIRTIEPLDTTGFNILSRF